MTLSKKKVEELERRMAELSLSEEELVEKFVLGSGKGGQKINKTSSCVYLKHLPTGIEIKCQRGRSREMNRFFARRELCEKVEEMRRGKESAQRQEREKIRRQKRRRSRRTQIKVLAAKNRRAQVKELRQSPGQE